MPRSPCGFKSRPLSVWKRCVQERSINRLDERVQAEVRLVVPAGDGECHLGERGARCGDARLAKERVGQDLAGLRRVERRSGDGPREAH